MAVKAQADVRNDSSASGRGQGSPTYSAAGGSGSAPKSAQTETYKNRSAGAAVADMTQKLTDAAKANAGTPAVDAAQQARYQAEQSAAQYAKNNPYTPKANDNSGTPNGGSGGGSGSGSPAASAAPVDNTPVASPGDYYNDAAATTQRITEGVDMAQQIADADRAWNDATRGFEKQAGDILNRLENVTAEDLAAYAESTGLTIADATKQINDIITGLQDKMQPAEAGRVGRVDTVEEERLLQQIVDAQKEQSENQINFAVQQGVNELQRAEEDAQQQFQTQRNQIAANEAQSKDNQALYSEMRGDRGGIGKAQYDSIQNTAATNQLTVNREQTKLATDTARQIADLRAKGEFQKADELLKITQTYLSELMQLKQWADQTNVSIDEFNIGVDQWEQEYNSKIQQLLGELGINAVQYQTGLNLDNQKDIQNQKQALEQTLAQYGLSNAQYTNSSDVNRISNILSAYQSNANNKASTELAAANMTGAFSDATPTQEARARVQAQLASAGEAMLSAGLTPSDEQLSAMGWTKGQYNAYKKALADAQKKHGSSAKYIMPLLRDMVDAGKPLAVIQETIENAIASGKYSDNDKATEYGTWLSDSGWDGKNA